MVNKQVLPYLHIAKYMTDDTAYLVKYPILIKICFYCLFINILLGFNFKCLRNMNISEQILHYYSLKSYCKTLLYDNEGSNANI